MGRKSVVGGSVRGLGWDEVGIWVDWKAVLRVKE